MQRDQLVAPIITGLSRRLKRALQDSQNDMLDKLRAKGTTWSPELLPDETEHVDSIATAALPLLEEAADAGASLVGSRGAAVGRCHPRDRPRAGGVDRAAAAPASAVEPDGLDGAEEAVVTEHVGSAFREWKGERIEGLAGDHVVAAVSLGTLAAVGTRGPASSGWPWQLPAGPRARL